MLYFDRIDVSEGINVNKTSASKECIICHYLNFFDKGFKFEPNFCNGCHDVLVMSMNFSSICTLNIYTINYHCISNRISKFKAANSLQKAHSKEKSGTI